MEPSVGKAQCEKQREHRVEHIVTFDLRDIEWIFDPHDVGCAWKWIWRPRVFESPVGNSLGGNDVFVHQERYSRAHNNRPSNVFLPEASPRPSSTFSGTTGGGSSSESTSIWKSDASRSRYGSAC